MIEQFDEDLKYHIQHVFENFEDPSADEGWSLLREKFPKKEKDRGVIWLWFASAAAILLLALGIGTWVNLKKEQPEKLSYKPVKIVPQKNDTVIQTPPAKKQEELASTGRNKNSLQEAPVNSSAHTMPIVKDKKSYYVRANVNNKSNPGIVKDSVSGKDHVVDDNKTMIASNVTDKPVTGNEKQAIAALTAKDTAAKSNVIVGLTKPIEKPKRSLFDDDKKDNFKVEQPAKKEFNSKAVQFSVYAATYFNYAKGSSNQVNLGAGVTSDIRLSKNLKLSTGMAIAQNSLSYASQQAISGSTQFSLAKSAAPLITSTSFNSIISVTSFKNYNAQLVGLDVPVNLKYEFNPEKNDSYFALGLSSGTFINESYTYQYGLNPNNITQTQTTSNSFSNFYFAKTLNVSFGIGYPINKTNRLTIEPFLKYPLDGLGSQQIKFGAGGINLKFDFQPSKK